MVTIDDGTMGGFLWDTYDLDEGVVHMTGKFGV